MDGGVGGAKAGSQPAPLHADASMTLGINHPEPSAEGLVCGSTDGGVVDFVDVVLVEVGAIDEERHFLARSSGRGPS